MNNKDRYTDSMSDEPVLDGDLVEPETDEQLLGEGGLPDMRELQEEIQALKEANNELDERFIRAKAETDNARRIASKEVEKARKFALEKFASELLAVKDSLDQAAQVDLEQQASESLIEKMSEGLGLTLKQLDSVFERFKIETVNPEAGDTLDPELHQAMTRQPSDEVSANNIVASIQPGYTLNGRLLRPAMVIVSSGP